MLRSTKMPSKYTSLARLQEIAANHYCGRDGQDYEAEYVDRLIAEKADKLSDELIEDYYDEQDAYAEHLASLEAEYFVAMDETLLATSSADTCDGQLPAGAFADWTALVAERAAAVVAAVFHAVPRKLKNILHTRYTSVTTLFVGTDAEHQGDVPMKIVDSSIFQNIKTLHPRYVTEITPCFDLHEEGDFSYQVYELRDGASQYVGSLSKIDDETNEELYKRAIRQFI